MGLHGVVHASLFCSPKCISSSKGKGKRRKNFSLLENQLERAAL